VGSADVRRAAQALRRAVRVSGRRRREMLVGRRDCFRALGGGVLAAWAIESLGCNDPEGAPTTSEQAIVGSGDGRTTTRREAAAAAGARDATTTSEDAAVTADADADVPDADLADASDGDAHVYVVMYDTYAMALYSDGSLGPQTGIITVDDVIA